MTDPYFNFARERLDAIVSVIYILSRLDFRKRVVNTQIYLQKNHYIPSINKSLLLIYLFIVWMPYFWLSWPWEPELCGFSEDNAQLYIQHKLQSLLSMPLTLPEFRGPCFAECKHSLGLIIDRLGTSENLAIIYSPEQ